MQMGDRSYKMPVFLPPHYHSHSFVLSGHCVTLGELFWAFMFNTGSGSLTGNFGPCWAQQGLGNTQSPEQRPK